MNTAETILAFPQGGIFVLFVVLIVGVLIAGIIFGLKRRKELSAWASKHNMSFSSDKDSAFGHRFPAVKPLNTGHSRYGKNFIQGEWKGRNFIGFDFHYTTGSGKNSKHHSLSGVAIASSIPLKPLFIRPEGFFDKLTEFFGFDDIDFESAEFSKKFFVKAKDKRWAYDVIHARAMEFLLASPRITLQFEKFHIIAFRENRLFKPHEFGESGDIITGLLDLLPDYVVEQQKGSV